MKFHKLSIPILVLALLLGACGNQSDDSGEIAIDAIYTSAAMTFEAQKVEIVPTETPTPQTATPTTSPTVAVTRATNTIKAAAYDSAVSNTTACDASSFISDVTIPDGTELAPGEAFTKTWEFENTGTCTWSTSYSIKFVSGKAMSGSTTTLSTSVSTGETIEISVDMVAPSSEGDYTGYWIIQNAAGTSFGQSVYVQIDVTDDASTVTPTSTATDEGEVTSTPTTASTSTSTSTPVPSSTPTTAPTSTSEPAASDDTETSS